MSEKIGKSSKQDKKGASSSKTNKTEKDEDEKQAEGKPTNLWNIAIGGSALVALMGVVEMALCFMAQSSESVYMNVIEGYDNGNLLGVLGIVGIIAAMVGMYGATLSFYCSKPRKAKRLRYMIYSYFGWGGGVVFLLFMSFVLTFSGVGNLEVVFKPGFSAYVTKYAKDETARSAIDTIQKDLGCCGNYNHTEWFAVAFSEKVARTETAIPESCCRETPCTRVVPNGETEKLTPSPRGCVDAIVKRYGSTLNIRAMILVAIAIVEAATIVVIFMEVRKIRVESTVEEEERLLNKSENNASHQRRRNDSPSVMNVPEVQVSPKKVDDTTSGNLLKKEKSDAKAEKKKWNKESDHSEDSAEGKKSAVLAQFSAPVPFSGAHSFSRPSTPGIASSAGVPQAFAVPPGYAQSHYGTYGVGYASDYSMHYS